MATPDVLRHVIERPITSGSAYRVPDSAYPNWGLVYTNEGPANHAYRTEWNVPGGDKLPALVGKASEREFKDDFALRIRSATAEAIADLVYLWLEERKISARRPLHVIEIGAGAGDSAKIIHRALPDQVKDNIFFTLVDPSKTSLEHAEQKMRDSNIKAEIKVGSDIEVLPTIEAESAQLFVGVASIHHHARIPWEQYAGVLEKGGMAFFGDWHQRMWTHPGYVYSMLEQINLGDNRDHVLNDFITKFPQARRRPVLPYKAADRKAMRQIINFWVAMADISQEMELDGTPLWFLEGHRDVTEYIRRMNQAGLDTKSPDIKILHTGRTGNNLKKNPFQVLPDSTLLMVSAGQKPIRYNQSRLTA